MGGAVPENHFKKTFEDAAAALDWCETECSRCENEDGLMPGECPQCSGAWEDDDICDGCG